MNRRTAFVLLVVLLLGPAARPWCAGPPLAKGWHIVNAHGTFIDDALRVQTVHEVGTVTRANYRPACYRHMYPMLPDGMSNWPRLDPVDYPDIFKFREMVFDGASTEAHGIYRSFDDARRTGVWLTDPRDHAVEYLPMFSYGAFRAAYLAIGYRLHCEQDLEVPSHQKVCSHSLGFTTTDRSEFFTAIDPLLWRYPRGPDNPAELLGDALMPYGRSGQLLPICLSDVEDDDDGDERPDGLGKRWDVEGPFDFTYRGPDGPETSAEGDIAYWARPDGGVIPEMGRRPAPHLIVKLAQGVWGTYGGHPQERIPGLNGGTPGKPNMSGDVEGDFFLEYPDLLVLDRLPRWRDLIGKILLRTRNRTVKALIEASHSLPSHIDDFHIEGGAHWHRGYLQVPRSGGDEEPRLSFRVQENRTSQLRTLRLVTNTGFEYLGDGFGGLVSLDRTDDADKSLLPFAKRFTVDLRKAVPNEDVDLLTIEVEDQDGHWTREEIRVRLVEGPNSLKVRTLVEPNPVVADQEALFHADITVEGFGPGRSNAQRFEVTHRWLWEGGSASEVKDLTVPDGAWKSQVERSFDRSFVGRKLSYEVSVRLRDSRGVSSTGFTEFRVRDPLEAELEVGQLRLAPSEAEAGDHVSTRGSYTVAALGPGETVEVKVVESLVGPTVVPLATTTVTRVNGTYELAPRTELLDRRFKSGVYRYRVEVGDAGRRGAQRSSDPCKVDMGPLRITGVSVVAADGGAVRRGGKALLQLSYELFGPYADPPLAVTERHRLDGPTPLDREAKHTRGAGSYTAEIEVAIPEDAALRTYRYTASLHAEGYPSREAKAEFEVEAGRLRILSLRAVPDEVPPGEAVYFMLRYRRAGLEANETADVTLERRIRGPTERDVPPKTIVARGSEVQEQTTRWRIPADQPEGVYTFRVRLSEAVGPPVEREIVFKVSRSAQPSEFFLRVDEVWASTGQRARGHRPLFRYRDALWLHGTVSARDFAAEAPLVVSWETRDAEGNVVGFLTNRGARLDPFGADGRRWASWERKVVLPELKPGAYESTATFSVRNRFGDEVVRTAKLRFEVEDPIPEVEVFATDRKGGGAQGRFAPGDDMFVYVRPTVRGLKAEVDAKVQVGLVRAPRAMAGLPFAADRKLGNGAHDLYLKHVVPPDYPDGVCRLRGQVVLNIFPEREGGQWGRWAETDVRIHNPFRNLRFEVRPDPVRPGQAMAVVLRCDVEGLRPGEMREAAFRCRANGGKWLEKKLQCRNGPAFTQWNDKVPEDYPREFIALEGMLRSGRIEMKAAARVRVEALPTITITSPPNGHRTDEKVLTVSGTCADKRVTEGAFTLNGASHAIPIKDGRFSEKVVLRPGWNDVTISARNRFAQRSQSIRVFANIRPAFFKAVLTWDTNGTDVDLWVTDPQGKTTWYRNKSPAEHRKLDIDDTNGHGPETYTIEALVPGRYVVRVQYYRGTVPTNFKVDVTIRERFRQVRTGRLATGAGNERKAGSTMEFAFDAR
jgi:uncharacterized protein YfaP (DUF2135 family)